jgi:hypothetical protein
VIRVATVSDKMEPFYVILFEFKVKCKCFNPENRKKMHLSPHTVDLGEYNLVYINSLHPFKNHVSEMD